MKKALLGLGIVLFSAPVFAAEVLNAKLDASKENILVDLRFGGGCKTHKFELKMGACMETFPVRCEAQVIDKTKDDFCEALIHSTASFNLEKLGLNTDYYSRASLTIKDAGTGSVTVQLPEASAAGSAPAADGDLIRCKTHTGSDLQISRGQKTVRLQTVDGQISNYSIVSVSEMSLESNPPIAQTIFKLNDGRKINTEFRSGSSTGRGVFIRLDGSASPEFTCTK